MARKFYNKNITPVIAFVMSFYDNKTITALEDEVEVENEVAVAVAVAVAFLNSRTKKSKIL